MGWNPLKKIGSAVKSAVKFVGNAPKKIAKGAEKLVTDPGDWARNALKSGIQAAPILALPGVGGIASGLLGSVGLGGVANAASGALGALKGAAGTVGSKLGGLVSKIPGGGVIRSAVSDIAKSPVGKGARELLTGGKPLTIGNLVGGGGSPGAANDRGVVGDLGALIRDKVMGGKPITIGNVLGGAGDVIKSGVKSVKDHPELALAAANAAYGASRAKSADDLRKKGVSTAEGSWNDRAPLRAAGTAGMLKTERPELSDTFRDPTNPFTRGTAPRPLATAPALPVPTPARPIMPNVGLQPAPRALPAPVTQGDPSAVRAMLEEGLKRRKPVRGGRLKSLAAAFA